MVGKIVIFLIVIFKFSDGQTAPPTASCDFFVSGGDYVCALTIANPEGLETITTITGQHLEGQNDEDVTYIYRYAGTTANLPTIICTQFPNLRNLDLTSARIERVAENAISGCPSLSFFRIWLNLVSELPETFFANNLNLTYIDIDNNQLTTLEENIFAPLTNLQTLEIRNNPFEFIPGGIFRSQGNLLFLIMDNCEISEVNSQWFEPLVNLVSLNIGSNLFTTVPEGTFNNLPALQSLSFSGNSLMQTIPGNAFQPLTSLTFLDLNSNNIRDYNPEWVAPMGSTLQTLFLSFNEVEDLPEGAFANLDLFYLALWRNQLKTLNRNIFGNVTNLRYLDLDQNVINALDRRIFDETANNLEALSFWNNVCASGSFFEVNRNFDQVMQRLERCFRNFEFIIGKIFRSV